MKNLCQLLCLLTMTYQLLGCVATPSNTVLAPTEPLSSPLSNNLDGPMAQLQFDTKQLYQRLQKLTDDKSCQRDQECKVLGIGARPCGGPDQFIVYSENHTDGKMLAITSERYAKLKKEKQSRLGVAGTCQVLETPVAACQANKCVVLESGY